MASTKKRSSPSSAPATPRTSTVAAARGKAPARRKATLWENIKSIGGAVLIFIVIRTFLIEAYRIPSPSMTPTLLVGDWLFVNKLVYGPHIPFTSINLPGYSDPKRFDVVVFVSPPQVDQPWDPNPTLVKRLVGMPGDTLYMREGVLFIDGVAHRQGFVGNNEVGDPNEVSQLYDWQKRVALAGSRFGPAPNQPTHDNWGPFIVPAGHFFMMGDNRYNSKDSRYWSFVPRENVRGRPMFVYYSWNADDSDRTLPFITDIRWRRIGTRIR